MPVYDEIVIHIDCNLDRLLIRILIMCFLIERVIFICIIQMVMVIDYVGVLIPYVQPVLIGVT